MTPPTPSHPARRRVQGVVWAAVVAAGTVAAFSVSCTHNLSLLRLHSGAAVTTTSGAWSSMIYGAALDSGEALLVDLGWTGTERAIRRVTTSLGRTAGDVKWVFITHAHRDHIGGWRDVAAATFVLHQAEVPFFTGEREYQAFVPRVGDKLNAYPKPRPADIRLLSFTTDTAFTLGGDTVHAFGVPGHTAGSAAYVVRGILFVGDAANWRPLAGFRGARKEYTDDLARSRASMASLWRRIDSAGVRVAALCTAHAKCALADSGLRRHVLR